MRLLFVVTVAVDETQIIEDNPPEDIKEAIGSEITASLNDAAVRRALGVIGVSVVLAKVEE
jgi:hypothetical protein